MLLDRISSVILCADEAKSIYRILSTHLTLFKHTCNEMGGAKMTLASLAALLCIQPTKITILFN